MLFRSETFNTNESTRQTQELEREKAETARQTVFDGNEANRIGIFNANEATRQGNETTRQQAEAQRATAESSRASAEEQRKIDHANRSAELDGKANKIQEDWITPTLLNGATHRDGNPLQYMKDEFGFVHMRGELDNVATDVKLFDFPVGYRPIVRHIQYLVPSGTPFARDFAKVVIAGGWGANAFQVLGLLSSPARISCNNISFKAEG